MGVHHGILRRCARAHGCTRSVPSPGRLHLPAPRVCERRRDARHAVEDGHHQYVSLFSRVDVVICVRMMVVEARYYSLLEQSLQYCATKLAKSRILTQDHAYFASHIYTAAFYRCSSVAAPLILHVIEAYSTQLEDAHTSTKGTNHAGLSSSSPGAIHACWLVQSDPSKELSSAAAVPTSSKEPSLEDEAHTAAEAPEPEDHPPTPHDQPPHLSDSLTSSSALPLIERRDAVIAHFRQFKAAASIALGLDNNSTLTSNFNSNNYIQRPSILPVQATPFATLDLVFQHGLRSSSDDDDVAFLGSCPQLYVDAPLLHAEVVRTALGPFLDRLKTPSRDSVNLVLAFISTFIEDSSAFLSNDRATTVLPWHVVPGYFVCVRAFVGVFRKVCLRRKSRRHVITKGADVVLNPWFPYWTSAELEPVYDGLGDVLAHGGGALLNVFVQVILENTNMYDPQSVDYAFNVLQNVFETAAASTHDRPRPSGDHPPPPPPRGTLPMELDLEYFLLALRQALTSSHFQILLKVLAFVYATADLFESKRRQKLLAGVMLHEHFFPLFLHWNEEVRRMFGHLVVHKLFLSSRLDLPLVSDRVLLASSPFFRPQHEPAPHVLQGLASYFAPPPSVKKLSAQAVAEDHNAALERLIVWDTTAAPRQSNQKQKQERLFRDSLSNDDLMLDLSVTSKLDAMLKMIAEQVQSHGGDDDTTAVYFPRHLQVYAHKALSQYVGLLWMYYKVAFDDLSVAPSAPTLEFNVQNFFSSD
ncbi:hypothetical protein, variant 3 [Aphanomyces astaci]|uniref:Uncharacterized protein n=1 Tax=Aphanomyces astaci TaxID=112090 RepID=W4FKU9_APHAT|nr:hypothetical protein, variant 3 [Aphanomyces astaci]ETV68085.1 hypothetical protein, variant 3 [Aphanomyces astaci]|eukprot:XP_009842381.1 hypothetical protein, variant 3 [Aphanomyces astaci]